MERVASAIRNVDKLAGVVAIHPEGHILNKVTDVVCPCPVEYDILQDAEGRLHEVVGMVLNVAKAVRPLLPPTHQLCEVRLELYLHVLHGHISETRW